MTDLYAVFGDPIAHSKSPQIHQMFAKQTGQDMRYNACQVRAGDFSPAVQNFFHQGGRGLNCTVPLKQLAHQYAHELSPRAVASGAVNTLYSTDGNIFGDNTDGVGLLADLHRHNIAIAGSKIALLGAGGAGRGIILPLLEAAPQCVVIANRTVATAQDLARKFAKLGKVSGGGYEQLQGKFDLIINATSLSLRGDLPPLPDDILAANGSCYDLAYADTATPFVLWGKQHQAAQSLDGLGMLVEQAAESFFIWRGIRPKTQPVLDSLRG